MGIYLGVREVMFEGFLSVWLVGFWLVGSLFFFVDVCFVLLVGCVFIVVVLVDKKAKVSILGLELAV